MSRRHRRWRLGTYNCRVGRRPRQVRREVHRLMRRGRLDALTLQEAAGYVRHLRAELPDRFRVVSYPGRGVSARDSAVVVDRKRACRLGRHVGARRLFHLCRGWERAPRNQHRGLHHGRRAVSCRIGPLRVLSMHLPPGPHHSPNYPRRADSHAEAVETLTDQGARWTSKGRPWVFIGDANMGSRDARAQRMARTLEGTLAGRGIDWLLAGPGLRVVKVWEPRMRGLRSDHEPRFAVVEVER